MAKVSVIIPIYNVEKYVEKCIESVMNQTLLDIEIICIDDGSTDDSGNIVDRYSKSDSRIKVIHKKNTGYGSTINLGISEASGKYIGIVESDDFIECQMYEQLYKIAEENDLDYIKANYYEYSDTGKKVHEEPPICDYDIVYSEYENMNKLFIYKSIWAGIYKKEFLVNKKIKLLETAGASYQDTSFWFKVCICAHRAMLIKNLFVNYRIDNDNSSVNSSQKVFCICDEIEECKRYLENSNLKKEKIMPYFYKYMYNAYQWNIIRINAAYLEEFLIKTSDAMKDAYKILKSEKEFLTLPELERISFWAETPKIYYRMLMNNEIMKHNAKTYAKMFEQYISEKHIYIYGAGKVGRKLEKMITRLNPDCEVEFLVSTTCENAKNIHLVSDINIDKECKVVIAVADLNIRLEMRKNAAEAGFKDILIWDTGMDYICNVLDTIK